MPSIQQSLEGWTAIDLPIEQARALISRLVDAQASFAHTSEPGEYTRRVYYFSDEATRVVREFAQNLDVERAASSP